MGASIGKPLSAGLAAILLATTAGAQPRTEKLATVLIGGQPSGSYREATLVKDGTLQDTVEQHFIFNRLESRVELSETDVYREDAEGRLLGGHSEASSSKTPVVVDFEVRGDTIALTTHSGGRDYANSVHAPGTLLGPAGVRRLMGQASKAAPDIRYATFIASLGGIADVTLKYLGDETVDGVTLRKFSQTTQGMPGASTLWIDPQGYTAAMTMDSPFGPIRIVRGTTPATTSTSAPIPAEAYDSTLALSNIQLPHPRAIEAVTVEITKRPGAEPGWPQFASADQKVLEQSDSQVILQIRRPGQGPGAAGPAGQIDRASNALIQSDDPAVVALAQQIAGSEIDPWRKALRLQAWVAANMQFDTGIAIAPASELIHDRHGTCVGYSILLASLARAQGIPTRIRMGYVYDHGIWGGHAWTEMLLDGRWLPVDSAEYRPGVADAARIGAITARGENGAIEGVGDLALLFGKVDIRILSYERDGHVTPVGRSEPDHTARGGLYSNPWLGLSVRRPAGFSFAKTDAHWPDDDVLALQSPGGMVRIAYLSADDEPIAARLHDSLGVSGTVRPVVWKGARGLRIDGDGKSAVAVEQGDVIWALVAEGEGAAATLDAVSAGVSIADLQRRPAPARGGASQP